MRTSVPVHPVNLFIDFHCLTILKLSLSNYLVDFDESMSLMDGFTHLCIVYCFLFHQRKRYNCNTLIALHLNQQGLKP